MNIIHHENRGDIHTLTLCRRHWWARIDGSPISYTSDLHSSFSEFIKGRNWLNMQDLLLIMEWLLKNFLSWGITCYIRTMPVLISVLCRYAFWNYPLRKRSVSIDKGESGLFRYNSRPCLKYHTYNVIGLLKLPINYISNEKYALHVSVVITEWISKQRLSMSGILSIPPH